MNTENVQNNCNTPREEYTFTYTVDELKKSYKKLNKLNSRRSVIIGLVIIIYLIIFNISSTYFSFTEGLCLGLILGIGIMYFALFFKGLYINKKAQKKSLERISESIYNYKVYQDYLVLNVHRNSEKILEQKIYFRDISKFFDVGEHIVFQHQNQLYILKKEMLKENSYFLHFTNYRFAPL